MGQSALLRSSRAAQLQELRVEEIELADEKAGKAWYVTLGFHRKKDISTFGGGLMTAPPKYIENRSYKTLRIDAESGNFMGMKMREVAV